MEFIAKEIIKAIGKSKESNSQTYRGLLLKEIEFIKIPYFEPKFAPKNFAHDLIVFIDGGNSELFSSASFSVHLIKTSSVVYFGQSRKNSFVNSFIALARIDSERQGVNEGNISNNVTIISDPSQKFLELEVINMSEEEMHMDNSENGAGNGAGNRNVRNSRTKFSRACGIARRLAEFTEIQNSINRIIGKEKKDVQDMQGVQDLQHVRDIKVVQVNTSEMKDISGKAIQGVIIIDGSLDCVYEVERKSLKKIEDDCLKNNIVLLALSKTTSLTTDEGVSLAGACRYESEKHGLVSPWFAIIEDGKALVKLHPDTNYVLRMDFLSNQRALLSETLSLLINHCGDPVFKGYPYGLIEADDESRVTELEAEDARIEIKIKIGSNIDLMDAEETTMNAHGVLDNMRF